MPDDMWMWKWQCRVCGAEGKAIHEIIRTDSARIHAQLEHKTIDHVILETYAGRLMHVWTLRREAVVDGPPPNSRIVPDVEIPGSIAPEKVGVLR